MYVWLYSLQNACYQWVQVYTLECVMSHISEYLRALKVQHWLSVCLSLPLLSKHEEKKEQREHRMRKEAEGQHKEKTIKDMEENGFMWIQQYWCKRKKREKIGKTQMEKKKIHSMINYLHCIPEKHWGKRTVGTGGIHKDTESHSHTYTIKQSHKGLWKVEHQWF